MRAGEAGVRSPPGRIDRQVEARPFALLVASWVPHTSDSENGEAAAKPDSVAGRFDARVKRVVKRFDNTYQTCNV